MPGCFAHIALVNVAADADTLDRLLNLTDPMKAAILQNLKYCELGAVSPDYPFLTLISNDAAAWANTMHYDNTADIIRKGVQSVSKLSGEDWNKGVAWLFGYVAHVVADLTVHPVVQLKVGPYDTNKLEHRRCEMNQDVHIFIKKGLGNPGTVEHIRNAGIATCTDGKSSLHPVIKSLWGSVLEQVFPTQYRANMPDLDAWHTAFVTVVDKVTEEGRRLFPFARHVAEAGALVLPNENNLQMDYLENLECPDRRRRSYVEVFDIARDNIVSTWNDIGAAITQGNPDRFALSNANLDTGLVSEPRSVFWS
ncbi:MAG: zinc dependent phospholipase C family protein [Verrucomicrobia bacterium]|nr:zinc dependent phospholipase C family protein [Verrucomicrobiota bacterium]